MYSAGGEVEEKEEARGEEEGPRDIMRKRGGDSKKKNQNVVVSRRQHSFSQGKEKVTKIEKRGRVVKSVTKAGAFCFLLSPPPPCLLQLRVCGLRGREEGRGEEKRQTVSPPRLQNQAVPYSRGASSSRPRKTKKGTIRRGDGGGDGFVYTV